MGTSVLSNSSPHGSLCFVKFISGSMGASVLLNSYAGPWEPLFCQIHKQAYESLIVWLDLFVLLLIPDRNFLITMGVLKNKITKKHYNLIFKT
jgi:hypothetical protein